MASVRQGMFRLILFINLLFFIQLLDVCTCLLEESENECEISNKVMKIETSDQSNNGTLSFVVVMAVVIHGIVMLSLSLYIAVQQRINPWRERP